MSAISRRKGGSQYSASKNFYHISFASECQLCFETSHKPRRLPCEHEFCKDCLAEYFERNIPVKDPNTFFPCPSCNTSIDKPSLPITKWTKAFKLDKQTLFYTGGLPPAEENGSAAIAQEISTTKIKTVRRRVTIHDKPSSRSMNKRSAVHFTGLGEKDPGFNTVISTDELDCVYWGGCILSNGHILLPDFYNRCVKVFTVNGDYVFHEKVYKHPFDVAEIHDKTIVVSHGAREKLVSFLSYNEKDITYTGSIPIKGYLYSITRRGKECHGIFETTEGQIKLARITAGGNVITRDPGELAVFLSTGTHLKFNETDKLYYFTEKRNLLCVDTDFNILYFRSYPYLDTDHYILGSIALDSAGTIFVGSDWCILRIDKDRNKPPSVMSTKIDPFHIIVSMDGSKLVLVGKNNRVSICIPPKE